MAETNDGRSLTPPLVDPPVPFGHASAQPPSRSLTDRIPGQAAMSQVLALQEGEPARSWWERFIGVNPLNVDARPWYKGAVGEIIVGKILARLGPEWTVLHAVPVGAGGTDIDHVLIGPPGVFTLNTKNHAGQPVWVAGRTLMVAGQKQLHIPKAFHEAARAQNLLSAAVGEPVPVTGLIVLVEPESLKIKEPPVGVTVVTGHKLLRWLRRQPPVLSTEQNARIAAVAALPDTWHRDPQKSEDPATLQSRSRALRAGVLAARRRRRAWAAGRRGAYVTVRLAYAGLLIGGGLFLLGTLLGSLS